MLNLKFNYLIYYLNNPHQKYINIQKTKDKRQKI